MSKEDKNSGGTIAQNRKARHDFFIEDKVETKLFCLTHKLHLFGQRLPI
jgi:tmRNA-binding protein